MSGSNCTTGDVTWTVNTTVGKGSPGIEFGNQSSQSCIKLGSGKKNYYSKMTFTTSAFTSYNVSSVVLYISSNNGGSKTVKVTQGSTTIGTGSQSFSSSTWVNNCTRNTTAGSGGDLTIEISSDATATFVHSIKVTYSAASCTTPPTVGSSLTSVSADATSITATVPISAIGGCNITANGLVYSSSETTPTVGETGCYTETVTACGSTAANKEVTINGLACGTTYYVRGYATNAASTSYTDVTTQATSACPKYTVTLKDDNTELEQTTAGASVTLPSRTGCTGYTFAGWSTTNNTSWTSTAPSIIQAGNYTPTANINLYPVYTKEESGGSGFSSYTKVTSAPSDWSGKYLISDGTSTATGDQFSATALEITTLTPGTTEYTAYEFTITKNGNNNNYYIISPDGTYYVGYSGSSAGLAFSTSTPSTNSYLWTCSASDPMTLNVGTNTRYIGVGTESATSVFKAYSTSGTNAKCYLYKRIEGGSTTYYISVPNCCENIVPAPEVEGTSTKNTITLSWTNVTGANGYTVTCSGGTPGEVTSSGNNRTCEITGLDPNTAYTWTVVATYTSPYCQATAANGSTTTKQVYTVSYNKNGGTIANLPSGGSYAEGETVNVAAKPDGNVSKSGYEFTGWNTATTPSGSSTHYDADGTATFTMPASPVTLYAEWTAKKNYFVDRMHGNCDGEHTITIGGTVYNCYLREGQSYTVPDLSDNSTGSNTCVTGHSRFIGWVAAGTDGKSGKIGAQGQLVDGYTVVQGGTTRTAINDGMIYYAVWAEE